MSDQHQILGVGLARQRGQHVGDVRFEVDAAVRQVRAFGYPGERVAQHPVAFLAQGAGESSKHHAPWHAPGTST